MDVIILSDGASFWARCIHVLHNVTNTAAIIIRINSRVCPTIMIEHCTDIAHVCLQNLRVHFILYLGCFFVHVVFV